MKDFKTNNEFYPWAVNSLGEVKNLLTFELVDCKVGTHGYKYKSRYLVHRMVATLFIPNPDNKPCVNHIDSNRLNNRVDNLEWVTHSENMIHMVLAGRNALNGKSGEENPLSKHSDEKIHKVCKDLSEGMRSIDVSRKHGIDVCYIKDLKAKNSRKDITEQYTFPEFKRQSVSEATVRWICKCIAQGVKRSEIIERSNNPLVTINLIKNIRRKSCYKSISDEYF